MLGNEWIQTDATFCCPECGNTETRISGNGGMTVGVKCADRECDNWSFGGTLLQDHEADGVVFDPPEKWVVGEVDRVRYQCPECDSSNVGRRVFNDGCGFFDVKIQCNDCNVSTWE